MIRKWWKRVRYENVAKQMNQRSERGTHWETFLLEMCKSKDEKKNRHPFKANQVESEIRRLLKLVEEVKPKTICEIGSWKGGNLFLLSQVGDPSARILSVDIAHDDLTMSVFPKLVKSTQTLECLHADSSLPETVNKVQDWMGDDLIDCLFIDGDHSYQGVASDYEKYSPFVRPGGIIVFHDIVEDFKTRHGRDTGTYVGEVPKFWKEISGGYSTKFEFIDDPEQDAYGLGAVIVPYKNEVYVA